jgi:hypothetical protein
VSSMLRAAPEESPSPPRHAVGDPEGAASARTASGASTHVDETDKEFRARRRRAFLLVLLFALVDAIIIKTTWNQVQILGRVRHPARCRQHRHHHPGRGT